jgi:peptidoglycan-N-acetylglucosamine deacetylase
MFTFRNTTLVFFILMAVLNILWFSGFPVRYYDYILVVVLYLGVSITLSFFIGSGYHMKALCQAVTDEKIVSLTFDDGPYSVLTPKLLDELKSLGLPAAFFCIGNKIKGNEEILVRMAREGHLIGTHSFTHSNWFDFFSPARMRKELKDSAFAVADATGLKPLLFRPPYGVINPMLKRALQGSGYYVTGFSNRAWDTSVKKKEEILDRILNHLKPGDVILLHDTIAESVDLIRALAEKIQASGYRIVPLDQLLNIKAYEI